MAVSLGTSALLPAAVRHTPASPTSNPDLRSVPWLHLFTLKHFPSGIRENKGQGDRRKLLLGIQPKSVDYTQHSPVSVIVNVKNFIIFWFKTHFTFKNITISLNKTEKLNVFNSWSVLYSILNGYVALKWTHLRNICTKYELSAAYKPSSQQQRRHSIVTDSCVKLPQTLSVWHFTWFTLIAHCEKWQLAATRKKNAFSTCWSITEQAECSGHVTVSIVTFIPVESADRCRHSTVLYSSHIVKISFLKLFFVVSTAN